MATFRYKAANSNGKISQGQVVGETRESAAATLDSQGLIPLNLREVRTIASSWQQKRGGATWRIEDKVLFTQKFASLIKAGIPLLTALGLVSRQTKSDSVRSSLQKIADHVANREILLC